MKLLSLCSLFCLLASVAAKADTTLCQAQPAYSVSYCSDTTPGAASGGYNSLPAWVNLNKALTSITVADNQVWGLDSSGNLWNLPNFKASTLTWYKTAAGIGQISAGHNLLCQINSNQHLYCSVSPNPQAMPADANGYYSVSWIDEGLTKYREIAVSAGNQIWAVDTSNNLYQIPDYTQPATTILVATGVREVAVDGKGAICMTDTNTNLSCTNWAVPSTTANSAGVHALTWVATSAQLTNISMADGKVYGGDSSGNLWLLPDYTNSATWERVAYGGTNLKTASSTVPSTWTTADFASTDVAVLLFMGQSNSSGINTLPTRFIAPSSPHVWGVTNAGWNFVSGNANGTTPFTSAVSTITSVGFSNWTVQSSGADMNLGFNDAANGNAANFAAFQWQGMINAGMKLPDLYIIHVGWASQGVDPADSYSGTIYPWVAHGVNLWQPLLTNTSQPSYALAPFSRRVVYLALQNLIASGKTPRIIGLQWNQWEEEAGSGNSVSIPDAPTNYNNLFNNFFSAEGTHFPVQIVRPLSLAYGATALSQMQSVFANIVANDPTDFSLVDISTVSSNYYSGGVLGGGDGSVHYNLDTHLWFANQAIGVCLTKGSCGPRITSLPTAATN